MDPSRLTCEASQPHSTITVALLGARTPYLLPNSTPRLISNMSSPSPPARPRAVRTFKARGNSHSDENGKSARGKTDVPQKDKASKEAGKQMLGKFLEASKERPVGEEKERAKEGVLRDRGVFCAGAFYCFRSPDHRTQVQKQSIRLSNNPRSLPNPNPKPSKSSATPRNPPTHQSLPPFPFPKQPPNPAPQINPIKIPMISTSNSLRIRSMIPKIPRN